MAGKSLREALLEALANEPYAFVSDSDLEAEVDRAISEAGLWGLVAKVKLKGENGSTIVVYLVDTSKVERFCAYDECSKIEDSVELDSCIARCVASKLPGLLRERIGRA